MSDEALLLDGVLEKAREAHAGSAPGVAFGRALAVNLGLGLFAALWVGGSVVLTRNPAFWFEDPEARIHIALNVVAILLVAGHAGRVRGPLDYKMSRALLASAFVFGVYALGIMAARMFFSRFLLSSAAAGAVVASVGLVWLKHQLTGHRVALISPLLGDSNFALPQGRLVSDPQADLGQFDVALVSLNQTVSAEWAKALSRAMLAGCKIRHLGEYIEELGGAVSLEHFEVNHVRSHDISAYRPMKRAIDVALCIALLPLATMAVLFGMAGTALTSSGPIFFVQDRAGLGGKTFRMWKIRTMRVETGNDPLRATVRGDRRITPFGGVLRRLRIDELPQIWNVLKGDMSLIGPRPEAVALHQTYLSNIPHYSYRYLVRPGITGWAQVSTPPSATVDEAQRKLSYDLFYVKHLSLALDLQIMARTFWTIADGMGVH